MHAEALGEPSAASPPAARADPLQQQASTASAVPASMPPAAQPSLAAQPAPVQIASLARSRAPHVDALLGSIQDERGPFQYLAGSWKLNMLRMAQGDVMRVRTRTPGAAMTCQTRVALCLADAKHARRPLHLLLAYSGKHALQARQMIHPKLPALHDAAAVCISLDYRDSVHITDRLRSGHMQALLGGTVTQLDGESTLTDLCRIAPDGHWESAELPRLWSLFQTAILTVLQQRYILVASARTLRDGLQLAAQHSAAQPSTAFLKVDENAAGWQLIMAETAVASTNWRAVVCRTRG